MRVTLLLVLSLAVVVVFSKDQRGNSRGGKGPDGAQERATKREKLIGSAQAVTTIHSSLHVGVHSLCSQDSRGVTSDDVTRSEKIMTSSPETNAVLAVSKTPDPAVCSLLHC